MAASTTTFEQALDKVAGQGIPDPRGQAGGYGDSLALDLGSQIMADLITERFNWKWNRTVAPPFQTNSFQQDYPQLALPNGPIEWGEDCDITDINNTAVPKPLNWGGPITFRKQLSRTSNARWRARQIAWMYNSDLSWGSWPGAAVVITPLLGTTGRLNNPILNFIDKNGNYLILTTFGTTGGSAPFAAASSPEGTTVADNTVVWTVVSGSSQGWRLDVPTNGAGPVYQITPSYQLAPPVITVMNQLLTPIPDSFMRHFQRGLDALCLSASPNPGDAERGADRYAKWLETLVESVKQGDKEQNAYGLVPATEVVDSRWWDYRGPRTADQPF